MKKAKRTSSSSRLFYIGLAAVAVIGVGTLAYLSSRPKDQPTSLVDTTLPKVASKGYVLGSPSAPVEVWEFGDFECPGCGQFALLTEPDIRQKLIGTGKMRLRFIDFPLPIHRNTWNASRAAACADEQGKFWEMHDVIYQNQDRWNSEATSNPDKVLKEIARQVPGLNGDQFDKCVDDKKYQAKIQAHLAIAESLKIQQTPTFVLNGRMYPGAAGYDQFKKWLESVSGDTGGASTGPTSGGPTPSAVPKP